MQENEIMGADAGTVALLNKSEIDMQISTAHKFPRSIKRFRDEAMQMVTLNESIAQECIYSLPRDGKNIEGPSARFAEVVASAWGNSRAGARVVSDAGDFVTAQGVFHDLERNVAITYEVQRRIVDKQGRRFKADMIGVTANAACSIALRNSILKGVPKAFWSDLYEAARKAAIGDVQTLANRRARALAVLQKYGVTPEQVFRFLGVSGEDDITLDHLATLFGITTALKDGDTTPEQAFSTDQSTRTAAAGTGPVEKPAMNQAEFDKNLPSWTKAIQTGKKTADDLIAMVETKAKLTDEQKAAIKAIQPPTDATPKTASAGDGPVFTYAELVDQIQAANGPGELDTVRDLARGLPEDQRKEIDEAIYQRAKAIGLTS